MKFDSITVSLRRGYRTALVVQQGNKFVAHIDALGAIDMRREYPTLAGAIRGVERYFDTKQLKHRREQT